MAGLIILTCIEPANSRNASMPRSTTWLKSICETNVAACSRNPPAVGTTDKDQRERRNHGYTSMTPTVVGSLI
jgi:hypothetical protein